jgi:GT2 family glycosyltransferase
MVFQPDVAERMLESAHPKDRPIVGGLCFAGGYGALMKVTMYVHEDNPDGTFNMRQAEEFPRDALVPVDATGAACLLVHRDALCAIGDAFRPHTSLPWFAETEKDGQPIGEDITFCLRARQLGIPIVVNTGVEVKHRKMGVLDLEAWDDYRSRLATFDGDVQAMAADYYSKV